MKTLRTALLLGLGAATLAACGDDGDGAMTLRKGEIDEAALSSGVSVNISGQTGTVSVPFIEPVPNVPDADLEAELEAAVSLFVQSDASGSSADLAAGSIVGSPAGPGEWSWDLNEDRDEATMTFFNESPGGLTLKNGVSYTATMTLTANDYIESVSAFSMAVTVTGG